MVKAGGKMGTVDVWGLDVTVYQELDGGAQIEDVQMEIISANIRSYLLCYFQLTSNITMLGCFVTPLPEL